MKGQIKKILISEEEIRKKVCELGKKITKDYETKENLIVIGILKGSFIFYSDLVREIKLPIEIDFLTVSSYQDSSVSSGEVKIIKDITLSVGQKNVLFVEDIIDTGFTISKIKEIFKERGAKSVKLCSLLSKPDRRKIPTKIDYEGFKIPDEFVVGYGLDYAEKYRNLPFLGVYDSE
jgi:hypoxanthine phosphoribosyltransferase